MSFCVHVHVIHDAQCCWVCMQALRLYTDKSPSDQTTNWGSPCGGKDHIHTFKILQSVSEFGGCWKKQNSPACTNSVRGFRVLKLETIGKKDYTVEEFIGFLTSCQPHRVTSVWTNQSHFRNSLHRSVDVLFYVCSQQGDISNQNDQESLSLMCQPSKTRADHLSFRPPCTVWISHITQYCVSRSGSEGVSVQ